MSSVSDEIAKLHNLLKSGAISQAEYDAAKARLIQAPKQQTDQERRKKSGCMGWVITIVLTAIAITAVFVWQEIQGAEVTALAAIYLSEDISSFDDNGLTCTGAGDFAFINKDAPITVDAGGSQTLKTTSIGDAVTRPGYCAFVVSGTVRDKDERTVAIGEGEDALTVECKLSETATLNAGKSNEALHIEVQINSSGAKCVKP